MPDVARFTRDARRVHRRPGRSSRTWSILATGYLPRFEFLAPDLLNVDAEGRPRLYLHAFSPAYPTLAVTGLLQPDSGVFSLDALAGGDDRHLAAAARAAPGAGGRVLAPPPQRDHRALHRAKVKQSTRHWFEVSHVEYLRAQCERTLQRAWRLRPA